MKRLLLFLLLVLFPSVTRAAETYWVSTEGVDTNCTTIQTEGTPAGNIAVAINCANASGAANADIVRIKAGTYTNSLTPFGSCSSPTTTFPSGTSYTDALTVQADTGATVIIQPGSGSSGCGALWLSNTLYLKFQDLIFDGTNVGSSQPLANLSNADRTRFTRVTFRNSVTFSGVFSNTASDFNEYINCTAHGNGTQFGDHGLYITGSDNLIDGGEFYDNAGYGIHIFNSSSSTTTNRNVVRNARIYANGTDTANGSCGIIVSAGDANKVYNNFIYEHSSAQGFNCGILVGVSGSPSSNAEVYNNTIVNNGNGTGYQINIQSVASGTIVRNNIAIEPAAGDGTTIFNGGTGSTLSHNSETDATTGYFVDVATDDYKLIVTSPAVDIGTTLTLFSTDFEGTNRPQGLAWDRGADEYVAPPNGVTVLTPNGGESVQVGSTLSITWSAVGIGGSTSQTFNASGSWQSPITGNVQVDVWGGGGGGGGTATNADGGGGGGGGAFSRETSFAVTASNTYTVTVGAGGAGGVGANCGSPGGDSWFSAVGSVFADDGNGGCNPIAGAGGVAGTGGEVSQGIGDTVFAGGNGGAGRDNNAGTGGGGGGSAGLASNGGNGAAGTGSAGAGGTAGTGTPSGAAGGTGGTQGNDGQPGNVPGAGGGGAGDTAATNEGGAGQPGRVIIYWSTAGTVNIELSRNNGSSWETLVSGTDNDGSYDWTAAGATTVQGLIRVTSTGGGAETDTSDAAFTIASSVTPTITVTSPTSGQKFKKGASVPVGWTSSDLSGNVRIDVSRDNGSSWDTVIASTPFNSSQQAWIATTPSCTACKVRVVSLNDTSVLDVGDAFTIRGTRIPGVKQ